jgi:hypothetical protein
MDTRPTTLTARNLKNLRTPRYICAAAHHKFEIWLLVQCVTILASIMPGANQIKFNLLDRVSVNLSCVLLPTARKKGWFQFDTLRTVFFLASCLQINWWMTVNPLLMWRKCVVWPASIHPLVASHGRSSKSICELVKTESTSWIVNMQSSTSDDTSGQCATG